ncbi:hypothetical protein MMC07_007706 [Pseudocyphellaria aurata]|nr:hypothetical protein [Pseudocyphellaria aurata]
MEEKTSELNEFVISDCKGYAQICIKACSAANFLMNLEVLEVDDLDPHDRVCTICTEELSFSTNPKLAHIPVKTPCGHIFGLNCIMMWLEPLYSLPEPNPDNGLEFTIEKTNASCPYCRREFFPPGGSKLAVEELEQHIRFWDAAYASAGVTRTAKEEQTRNDVVKYINFFGAMHGLTLLDRSWKWDFMYCAQEELLKFARAQKAHKLIAEHENRRIRLERIARKDLQQCCRLIDEEDEYDLDENDEYDSDKNDEDDSDKNDEDEDEEILELYRDGSCYLISEDGGYEYHFNINCDKDERLEFAGKRMEKAILDEAVELDVDKDQPMSYSFWKFFLSHNFRSSLAPASAS